MARTKVYQSNSLPAAVREVRALRKHVARVTALLERYARDLKKCEAERDVLAMLAADEPAFDNPLLVAEAKKVRDRVLADCKKELRYTLKE